jgi:two-component system cell cycle response regulator
MSAARAETYHPLAGFSDETPTEEITVGGGPRPRLAPTLPTRDHGTLTFVEGPLTGALVTLAPGAVVLLGRGAAADVHVPDDTVSRRHARIRGDGSGFAIEDLGSSGTWVNGWRVDSWRPLASGARVQLGPRVRLRFDLHDATEQRILVELYEASIRDALTGAYTRRYLRERLHAELSYAARHRTAVAMLMLDLDHFKTVNDQHGHEAGDAVLRVVVEQLRRVLRPEDVLSRYGGEELCILLRGLDAAQAESLAERLRASVAALRIATGDAVVAVTASIGVAATRPDQDPPEAWSLVERADRALYVAKRAGRDRCAVDALPMS